MSRERADTPLNQRAWRETELEKRCGKVVKDLGGEFYKFKSPARASVPDRMVVLPKHSPFFVEFKAWGKVATPGQFREADRLLALGCLVYFIDNLEDFEVVIDKILIGQIEPPWDRSPPNRMYSDFWGKWR